MQYRISKQFRNMLNLAMTLSAAMYQKRVGVSMWRLLRKSVDDTLCSPKDIGLRACHRLSSHASRNVVLIDNRIVAGVFTDTSARILTLYVITNRRGLAHQYIDGLDGE